MYLKSKEGWEMRGKLHQKILNPPNKKNAPKNQGALCSFFGFFD